MVKITIDIVIIIAIMILKFFRIHWLMVMHIITTDKIMQMVTLIINWEDTDHAAISYNYYKVISCNLVEVMQNIRVIVVVRFVKDS